MDNLWKYLAGINCFYKQCKKHIFKHTKSLKDVSFQKAKWVTSKNTQAIFTGEIFLNWAGNMAQMIEHQPNKHEALS
jgi:hypothetical protein